MTLTQLRHLIALADTGSFSRAARAVHLTQPALSRSIQSLEEELGPLFDRIGRTLEPTPTGREVLGRARQLVSDARDLELRSRARAKGHTGELRVGMGAGPGAMLMRALLLDVAINRPRWKVEVARGTTEALVAALRARELDALVLDVRSLEPAVDLKVEHVHEMRGAFMVRPGHPLARKRAVAFDALLAYPIASTPLSDEVARMLVQRYGPQAHPLQAVGIRCEEIAGLVEVAEGSDAVLLAIRASAPALVELRMSPALEGTARFGLVTLARRTQPEALDVVRQLMRERLVDAKPGPGRAPRARPSDSGRPHGATPRTQTLPAARGPARR
jgi:DNA-binding transcriptional LysR family regulator